MWPTHSDRLVGYDIARGMAVIGMILVNVPSIMGSLYSASGPLGSLLDFIVGRAAVLFVILAGIGVALMGDSPRDLDAGNVGSSVRERVLRRGVILLLAGYGFQQVWEADILHYYGLYLMVGALVLARRGRFLGWIILAVWLAGGTAYFDHITGLTGIDDLLLKSLDFWPVILVTELLFGHYYGFFPWFGFFALGMLLGRLPPHWVRRPSAILLLVAALLLTHALDRVGTQFLDGASCDRDWPFLMLTSEVFPNSPAFTLSAVITAMLILVTAFYLADRAPESIVADLLSAVGRTSLTVYVGHVLLVGSIAQIMPAGVPLPLESALLMALGVCSLAVGFAFVWLQIFPYGPLEWGLRRLSGSSRRLGGLVAPSPAI
jgi:uncharacterized membrane protein YeiB